MSKYTTSIRWFVESQCQYLPNVDQMTITDKIKYALPAVFNFTFPFYDQAKLEDWEIRFCKHFYVREIGQETFGLFQLFLEDTLNTIMPAYNKIYKEFDRIDNLLDNYNVDEQGSRENTGNSNAKTTASTTTGATTKFSDTPQTMLDLNDNKYLTELTQNSGSDNSSGSNEQNISNNETYSNNKKGNIGTRTYAELLKSASDNVVSVDKMVYNECEELFMLIY